MCDPLLGSLKSTSWCFGGGHLPEGPNEEDLLKLVFSHYIGNRKKHLSLTLTKSSLASIQVGNWGLQFLFSTPTPEHLLLFSSAQLLKLMKTELLPIKQTCSSFPTNLPTLVKYFSLTMGCIFPFLWLFEDFALYLAKFPNSRNMYHITQIIPVFVLAW